MPKAFTTWTVLPHKPLRKLEENLWTVEGTMPDGRVRRVMALARFGDGRVVVHNAIALEEPLMAELEAWGRPSVLVVPNGYHRQDARIWKDRYPSIQVVAPAGARKRVSQVVPVDGSYDDAPRDATVWLEHFDGMKQREGALVVRHGDRVTVVVNDAIMNQRRVGGLMELVIGPTGRPAVPRVVRWLGVSDRRALAAHFERFAAMQGLCRVVVSHGAAMTDRPEEILRTLARELAG